jgi:hypothetical protein
MNLGFQEQTLRVYQDVALSSFDLLAAVVTALIASYVGALDRLAIHYASTGLGISVHAHPQTLAQSGVHPFPSAV